MSAGSPALSVVIPCYDEAPAIPEMLRRFAAAMKRPDIEVILVDNGSTDGTAGVLADLLPSHPFARSVALDPNRGYGGGILAGLRSARGRFLGWTHADLQAAPEDVVRALEVIEAAPRPERALVKGNRLGRAWSARLFTWGMGVFAGLSLGAQMHDINGQPAVFHRSFFETWASPPGDFCLDLYAFHLARTQDLDILRFPVRFAPRPHGRSHWDLGLASKWRYIRRIAEFCRELKEPERT